MQWLSKKLKERWSIVRIIRLLLAIFVGIEGIVQGSGLLIAFAAILMYQSLGNYTCIPCGEDSGCGTSPLNSESRKPLEETSFEEIK